jgi:hypothetical protein
MDFSDTVLQNLFLALPINVNRNKFGFTPYFWKQKTSPEKNALRFSEEFF